MRITDSQIHLWTSAESAPPHHWRTPYLFDQAVADMDEAGVDRAVNCPAVWDPASMDYAVEAALAHPDRFATLGWFPLDPSDPAGGEALVDEWMTKPGMLGFRFLLPSRLAGEAFTEGTLDWLWAALHERGLPLALAAIPDNLTTAQSLARIGDIAQRFPNLRLLIDHLYNGPFARLPEAADHIDALVELARIPNVAVKASALPSIATDEYPFPSTHEFLRRTFDAYGPERMFWGTDITRLHISWREGVSMFVDELPWLTGRDLELVMGEALSTWIGWE